jgi:hypothetical protein
MIAIKIPNGLIVNAFMKLPFVNDKTERVDPQDGQGIFVICFTKHTSIGLLIVCSFNMPKYSQIYPTKQAEKIIKYNLFLFKAINTNILEFFESFSLL